MCGGLGRATYSSIYKVPIPAQPATAISVSVGSIDIDSYNLDKVKRAKVKVPCARAHSRARRPEDIKI